MKLKRIEKESFVQKRMQMEKILLYGLKRPVGDSLSVRTRLIQGIEYQGENGFFCTKLFSKIQINFEFVPALPHCYFLGDVSPILWDLFPY